FYIGCMGFPSCRSAIWLPNFVLDASVSDVKCENCQAQLMNFKFKMGSVPPMLPLQYTGCVAGCDNLLSESLQINNFGENRGGNNSFGEGGGGGSEFERNSNVNCNCGKPAKMLTVNKDGPNKGRTFYACTNPRDQSCNFFQWGDEITEAGNNRTAPPFRSDAPSSQRVPLVTVQPFNRQTNNEDNGQDIVCNCGTSAILLTVRKEGPNQGRQFYKCGGSNCNFFLWADQSQDQSLDNNRRPPGGAGWGFNNQSSDMEMNCNCGTPARLLRVVKDGPNKDREFFSCSKPRGQGCDFFQWADITNENRSDSGGLGGTGFQAGGNSDVCCNCGNPAKMLTVNKEGPNKGRTFYACAKPREQSCKFFQWGDENPEGGNTGSCKSLSHIMYM
ncbi:DNA topoisomerase 3-alpha-like, partial [Saccostrea cucullata]|uniref:DNA topoisomerase 3-alpha-like n=1 Tax=Saccostrea cuccullata TaxID=36930 RepID=UPI002ED46B6F